MDLSIDAVVYDLRGFRNGRLEATSATLELKVCFGPEATPHPMWGNAGLAARPFGNPPSSSLLDLRIPPAVSLHPMNTQRDHIRIAPAISAGLLPRVLPLLLIGGCRVL